MNEYEELGCGTDCEDCEVCWACDGTGGTCVTGECEECSGNGKLHVCVPWEYLDYMRGGGPFVRDPSQAVVRAFDKGRE